MKTSYLFNFFLTLTLFIFNYSFTYSQKKENSEKLYIPSPKAGNNCEKTYSYVLNGNLNDSTAVLVKNYIIARSGICNVRFEIASKRIYIDLVETIGEEDIKSVIRMAHHQFLLKDEDPKENL